MCRSSCHFFRLHCCRSAFFQRTRTRTSNQSIVLDSPPSTPTFDAGQSAKAQKCKSAKARAHRLPYFRICEASAGSVTLSSATPSLHIITPSHTKHHSTFLRLLAQLPVTATCSPPFSNAQTHSSKTVPRSSNSSDVETCVSCFNIFHCTHLRHTPTAHDPV